MHRSRVMGLALCALAAALSCASDPSTGDSPEEVKHVMVETDRPVEVSTLSRTVRVEVTGEGTVLRFDGARIFCPGYRGYAGRIGTDSGWVRVGALDFTYDREHVRVRSESRWTRLALGRKLNVFIEQDGTLGRSIFTD